MKKLDPKTDGSSKDIVKENIEKLKQIFPDVFSEEKVDFDKLQEVMGSYVEDKEERYSFTWYGKSQARRIAQTPSTGTLSPCKEESKNWDKTQNLFIEGDNLEVLKLLQKSYHKKVKMIYIDPPYNTGNEFIYPDNYKDNLDTYLKYTGQRDSEGYKFSTNTEAAGRYHTNWLNMMYPRLKLAKNLLRDDGVIFISIDDNEVSNLKKLCDEIFGEENFVRNLPTIMNLKGNNDEYAFAGTHEYTLVYCRNREKTKFNEFSLSNEEFDNWEEDEYGYYKKGANLKSTGGNAPRAKRPNLYFPIYIGKDNSVALKRVKDSDIEIFPITNDQEMSWRWSREKISNELYNIIVVRNGDDISIYKKQRPNIGELPTKKPKSIFYKPEYSSGNGTNELKSLFTNKIFDNPKPLTLIKDFIILGMDQDDIILDFFEGSGTTEHAVLDLNSEVGGKRKFICVQLPEPCQENSEAFKAGYKTIAEIGKERIRRAGEKILENNKDKDSIENLDVGFKVFKLDSSNIKSWDVDFDNLEQSLFDAVHNIKDERTEDDVLYEILLKYGLDLTLPIEERKIAGKTVYSIGIGALVICLDSEITIDVVEGIGKLKAELKPEVMRIVFKDSGFKDDVIKTNTIQILKQYNIEDVKSL